MLGKNGIFQKINLRINLFVESPCPGGFNKLLNLEIVPDENIELPDPMQVVSIFKVTSNQGGRRYWDVCYTSPQSIIIKFSHSLRHQLWGLLLNFEKQFSSSKKGQFCVSSLGIYIYLSAIVLSLQIPAYNSSKAFK